jgi:hypothetical protein
LILAKKNNYNLVKPKSIPQKNYRVTNFSFFHDFSIILSLITQRVFIAKTCAWVLWKGYTLSKIQKIKKPTTTIFFKKKIGFDDSKWNYSKCNFFKNLKKLPLNNNYMMYVWSMSFVVPAETFFLLNFKDCPLENFVRFLKIALPFICLNTSVWARWKGIFKSKIQKIKKPNNNNFFFKLI